MGNELLDAGFRVPSKQTDKCEIQLEENERLIGMKYNLFIDQFGQ